MKKITLFFLVLMNIFVYSQNEDKFHDTKGEIEVNSGGQLHFSLPIALPPGVKSVAPQINLSYTSGSGNSVAGYGWNIDGITAISRISKSIDKDNAVVGIQLDYSDNYTFNGQRLILKSGDYGHDGAIYETDKYSNLKIKSYDSISGKPWSGPLYWEITFEDGSQAWYGTLPNSGSGNTDLQYNIVKWKDVKGNYITYEYDQNEIANNNVTLIKSIKWGGNEILNKPHFNSIDFTYIPRVYKETAYHQGVLHTQQNTLSQILVSTNQAQFKKYVIDYIGNGTSYQFIDKITEFNSENEAANPINFTHAANQTGSEEVSYPYNVTNFNTKKYGDFDLDGTADYLEFVSVGVINFRSSIYAGVSPVSLQYDSSKFSANDFKNAVPVTFKKNNFVTNKVGLVIPVPKATSTSYIKDYEFQVYSINLQTNSLDFEYSKTVDYDSYSPLTLDNDIEVCNNPSAPVITQAESYDFNSDGISELILKFQVSRICGSGNGGNPDMPIGNLSASTTESDYSPDLSPEVDGSNTELGYEEQNEPENIVPGQTIDRRYAYVLIDLDQDLPIANSIYKFDVANSGSTLKFADLNGDAIQEIIIQKNSVFTSVINIKRDLSLNYSILNVGNFAGQSFAGSAYEGMLFGDFNGDSKIDLLVPKANESVDWDFYVSDGKQFIKYYVNKFIYYQSGTKSLTTDVHNTFYESGCTYGHLRNMQYQTGDLDGDGKSEIIVSQIVMLDHQWNAHRDQEWTKTSVAVYSVNKLDGASSRALVYGINFNNPTIGESNQFIQTNSGINFYRTKHWTKTYDQKVVPFGLLGFNRDNQQIVLTGKPVDCQGAECDQNYVIHYNYPFLQNISKITHIKQGGVTNIISYKSLNSYEDPNFYKPIQTEPYPYLELNRIYLSSVVSSMSQFANNNLLLTQDYRYRGILSNFHGRGIVGFRQFAKSSWYASGYANTKIWSGVESDLVNESVPLKEWTIRTDDENKIFPSNLSETNSELLSFKSTAYKIDKLINGQIVTSIPFVDKPRVVTALLVQSSRSKDFLSGIISENSVSYGDYYLPVQTILSINNGYGLYTSNYEYYNNNSGTGANYYIGRIKTKNTIGQAYGTTKSSKEEFTYDNHLAKTVKNWNRDDTGYLQETYDYDDFGNIIKKVISNSIDSQTQTTLSEYDPKGRFVVKKTDNLLLQTDITYNNWGQILTQTDPIGNSITNTYDGWGKILNSTSSLSGITSFNYEKLSAGAGIKVQETDPVGNTVITYTNNIGQKYKTTTKAFNQGQYISVNIAYDPMGRKISESEPYFEGQSATQWNTVVYDDNFFPAKTTSTTFNGKQVGTSVSGLTTFVEEINGYKRITSKTADALGNIISSTDKGGTINFKYDVSGKQLEAQYSGNIVTTKYDSWGRKSEFNDPSNGKYTYQYDGFGQIKQIKSPKGDKYYFYNNLGQLITQTEISSDGVSTNKSISFQYNNYGQLISRSGTSNGKPYSASIVYDNQGRITSSTENSNGKIYAEKQIVYDSKSRIDTYQKSLLSSGVTTEVTIKNIYSNWNGQLYQLKDNTTGNILSELQQTNEKGQILLSKLGASTITNLYSTNGFLTSTNHSSTVKPGILQVTYSFNAIKNELNSRTTGGDFTITEGFTYDDNNRLINWTNPRTGQNSSNTYDVRGRIFSNDQVGNPRYNNRGKIYQQSSIDLNANGVQNYNNDLLQTITYNENNDPIFLDGIKGDVAFEYGLSSMRQRVTYGGNFAPTAEGKFTKFYSEDGSFEIVKNNINGKEKHILYIGGNPYESSILFVKNYDDANGSYKFLHKDYIGSILAISDEAGNKLEQRHFDAWGNLTHLQIGSGNIITDKNTIDATSLLLERGYTGHEHFAEVGIIHMNGRLYDPLLRRFLNADENIQDPYNTQNYNKYGYVLNNPLMFNDPSGEIFGIGETIVSAIIIGAMVGAASYVVSAIILGSKFTLQGFFKAQFFGAISGAVTFGIGSAFTSTAVVGALGNVGAAAVQALAHGLAQGVLSMMQTGDLSQAGMSAITAVVTSGLMSGLTKVAPAVTNSMVGSMAVGGVIGGVTQELAGGNFWQGAAIGMIVAGLNHAMHKIGATTDEKSGLLEKNQDQNHGLQQDKDGYLVNNSKKTIYYKSENGSDKIAVKPGEKVYVGVDGLRVGKTVIKVTDGYKSITVNPNGTVDIQYSDPRSIIYDINGGKLTSPPDRGWWKLFDVIDKDTKWKP
ncbi:RHS repeat-associated core domain-containing protein [uncultured Chryseobacterium sp.]|uniref:RHS repeat-associated core domain-containing protein n=1 Tax=uncultured Chryseobacterium sp. TaxID=259322 RepID=UPI0025D97B6F|nr:RHS repeat-associated core domain-containing protein [uncultured Chryseobacterium sp.]